MSSAGLPFLPDAWAGDVIRVDAPDGSHIVVRDRGARHQLWLLDTVADGAALAAILPMDSAAPQRAEAAMRFWQYVTHGRRRGQPDRSQRPQRLTATLRALDGHLAGAPYRTIADGLFGSRRVADDPWKVSPLRDRVIRLVRQGVSLMQSGYRSLLRPRRRD
jgi:hypothetical protein